MDDLDLRSADRVAARLHVGIVDLDMYSEGSVRPCACYVALRARYDAHLLTKLEQLLDVPSRPDCFVGEVLNDDLSLVISHLEVPLVCI